MTQKLINFSRTIEAKNAKQFYLDDILTNDDYKSVFIFNMAVAMLLYLLLVATSPLLASYYNLTVITKIAPALFLVLPLSAVGTIQNTILARELRFDVVSRISFAASLISGGVAMVVAICGGGVWALVAQRISVVGVKSLLLWWRGVWRCHDSSPL